VAGGCAESCAEDKNLPPEIGLGPVNCVQDCLGGFLLVCRSCADHPRQ
jgi:hypothetical protein